VRPTAEAAKTTYEENIHMELVICNNGKATTTSMKVAEYFGKRHDDVLKAIRNLLKNETVNARRNFAECLKINELANGKKEPYYDLDRDGFTLLAMGFTGKQALQFKLSYIDAFNQAEKALTSTIPIIHDPQTKALMLLLAETDAAKHTQQIMAEQIQIANIGLAETRNDVTKLKESQRLESWQAHNVQKAVCRKVELWKELYPSINVKKAFPAIYRHLKEKFQVPKYDAIPSIEYDRAMSVIVKLNMSGLAGL
jgi:Rha family phage regulatory protein